MTHTPKGFTLIEMMLVLALIAILAGIGLPAFRTMILNNRITNTANNLLATLQLARSEAATQRRLITVCPTTNQTSCSGNSTWTPGAAILQGATVVRLMPPAATDVAITSASTQVVFDVTGQLSPLTAITLSVADGRGAGVSSRNICVSLLGRTSIVRGNEACP